MPAPTTGRWRSLRAGAFALFAGQIAIVGHVVAGGRAPDLPLLVAMSILLAGCLRGLGRQRRGFGAMLAAMVVTQIVFHLLLSLDEARHAMPADHHPIRMWVFHGVAAVIAAVLLASGEQLIFRLYSWLHRLIPHIDPPAAVVGSAGWTAMLSSGCAELQDRLAAAALFRRGPPGGGSYPTTTAH